MTLGAVHEPTFPMPASIRKQTTFRLDSSNMHAFIVRPFGIKQDVDFEKVEKDLIQPAMKLAGILGSTTAAILEAGNIRQDMFEMLLTADLVIADLSIHNANVFYELGIRHAMRDKKTYLIRCSKDEIPFDLKTDRYLNYDADNPAATLETLAQGLIDTVNSDRQDSPVFNMLPKLESQDPEQFLLIPDDFTVDLRITMAQKNAAKLALMAEEISYFRWYIPGLRQIGEALYSLRCMESARIVWEKIIEYKADDLQANDRLATIYQRLAESEINANLQESESLFERSNIAIEQLLAKNTILTPWKRAESYSLKARNAKTLWLQSWKNAPATDRPFAAITSAYLQTAMETYERGFLECLNHYFSGINALGLLITTITLAEKYPESWELNFDTTKLAEQSLAELKEKHETLKHSVSYSIQAGKQTLAHNSDDYAWLRITEADFLCLTEKRPARVKLVYQNIVQEASNFNLDATVRQLLIYQQLGIKADNVALALEGLPAISIASAKVKTHTLLFTGHMIDLPGRQEPRFPPEKEQAVRNAIKEAVQQEKENANGPLIGLAGGACGGDILFHEVCEEMGIKTELYLALPRDQFMVESVAFAGTAWIDRFNRLYTKLSWQFLSPTKELPVWLTKKKNYTIWERTNLWMLNQALGNGGLYTSLIALWDRKGGDAPGGTEHMVKEAESRGAKPRIIDIP